VPLSGLEKRIYSETLKPRLLDVDHERISIIWIRRQSVAAPLLPRASSRGFNF
jgi:hypothetical protein